MVTGPVGGHTSVGAMPRSYQATPAGLAASGGRQKACCPRGATTVGAKPPDTTKTDTDDDRTGRLGQVRSAEPSCGGSAQGMGGGSVGATSWSWWWSSWSWWSSSTCLATWWSSSTGARWPWSSAEARSSARVRFRSMPVAWSRSRPPPRRSVRSRGGGWRGARCDDVPCCEPVTYYRHVPVEWSHS